MSYDLLMQQALKLHQEGNLAAAEALYRQILETVPGNPVILNLLGLIAQSNGLDSQAVDLFSQAIAGQPSAEYYFNLAWSLQKLHNDAEAIKTYQRALAMQPEVKEAYNALGQLYARNNEVEKAETAYRHAIAIDSGYAEALANLAQLHRDLPQLLQLADLYPQEPLIAYYISLNYRENGNNLQARQYAETADRLIDDEKTKLMLAELALGAGESEKAADYFRQALTLNPKSVNALINLANFETNAEIRESLYKKALDLAPQDLDAHLNYADMLYRQNRLPEALEEYRAAVIINPQKTEISNNLGIILRDLGEYDEALGLFFNAFLKMPQKKEYSLNIAETLVLLAADDKDKAVQIAQNWLKNAPENPFAQHINAALGNGEDISTTEYSRQLFDLFAENYDEVMQNINYRLPELIAQAIAPARGTIIDLGCGTGLTGAALKNADNCLIGIDISAQMLQKAKARGIYTQLLEADIGTCSLPEADWIVAADVFGYIGDLSGIIGKCYPRNLCFSVAKGKNGDFELTPSGRYRHNPQYVRALLKKAGYTDVLEKEAVVRTEDGTDVIGIIFTAKG